MTRKAPLWRTAALRLLLAAGCSVAGVSSAAAQGALLPQQSAKAGPAGKVALAKDLDEQVVRLPVAVRLPDGHQHTGEMLVTHFRPRGAGPFPAVVFTHGRNSMKRHDPPRWRELPTVRFWTRRGFAVFVMTRVGYGELGQDVDPEAGGACPNVDYATALDAISTQIERVVAFIGTQPWTDARRIVLQGVSYGGFGTIAATAKSPPGVIGAINFVGGLGGNRQLRPRDPCRGDAIAGIAAAAGARAKLPMLWLYAENDEFWGPEWPKRWHQAYVGAGGKAQLVTFGPVGTDGHRLLGQGFQKWRPVVDRYLATLGFKLPVAAPGLKATGFARLEESARVPHVAPEVRSGEYARFLAADLPRAFALSPSGAWAWRTGRDATEAAIKTCQSRSQTPCALYAVDDRVVWQAGRK